MSAAQTSRRAEKLALLVGSNPLPNYIAAALLRPREVLLLYSPETQEPRDRLRAALESKGVCVKDRCIADATDARKIGDACGHLDVDHLHYSGGTKTMAAHARMICNLAEAQASYLDERKGLLRFDDQYDERLDQHTLGLSLDVVLQLHGVERVTSQGHGQGVHSDEDLTAIATQALNGFLQHQQDGRWLEQWATKLIRSCLIGASPPIVESGIHCRRTHPVRRDFEIDVALIRGHRVFVVSCTTTKKLDRCKSKLFEVAMRARQMGGDLARSALVCFLDGSDDRGSYVDQLRGDIAAVWDAPSIPKVFGLAELREWAGTSASPNLGTLQEWLDS